MKVRKADLEAAIGVIKAVLRNHKWSSFSEVQAALGEKMEERTLQRRLREMIAHGIVEKMGRSRGTRYRLAAPASATDVGAGKPLIASEEESLYATVPTATPADAIPLSDEGRNILGMVRQPIQQRMLVTYNRGLLDSYQPNSSSYLSVVQKARLAAIGHTPDAGQPAGTYVKEILQRLLVDLSWNSSRLEGNTYSRLDTERLIEAGQEAEGKSAAEAQMILNHKAAIDFIAKGGEEIGFNRYTILNLHGLLSDNLLPNPAASGRLRHIPVEIKLSVYMPTAIPPLIEELFDQILEKAKAITDPFEQAFFSMVHLPYLQPFDDVNKRVSRLAANIPFRNQNLSPLSFTDVPPDLYISGILGVYELNQWDLLRDVFIWAYERSAARYAVVRQSIGEPDLFRFKYHGALSNLIHDIIFQSMTPALASSIIRDRARQLPESDWQRFVDTTERELSDLHEGNFARYKVSQAEYARWRERWGK
jgi:hypothetical protein